MKIWKLNPEVPSGLTNIYRDYPPLLSRLLFNRGLLDKRETEIFLNGDYDAGLNSPFLFKDMEKAVKRIWQAILNKEKICIYGDYDADAITANAVLRQAFSYLGANAESYIPDRFTEGYGVNLEALEKITAGGSSLIITVDCGTNSADAANWCAQNGADLIITDHHEIIGEAPGAFSLINPKNPGDNYPDREITGVGVAFKVAQALLQDPNVKRHVPSFAPGWEKWLLDLVAIGTVADCHKLLGENRTLVKYGLKVLGKTRWPGLLAVIRAAGLDFNRQPPDTYTLGFVIAPRLNAAGRLEHAGLALDLLLERDLRAAGQKADNLEAINKRRQNITERIVSEAREKAIGIADRKVLVMMAEGWHKGVVGLVAGKIAEEFYRPTIVLEQGEMEATGSARSVGEFDIVEALKYASRHLLRYGGHKQAAGLTLRVEHFEVFYENLLKFADISLAGSQEPVLWLDAELAFDDLRLEIFELIAKLEPFGAGNSRPKFLVKNLEVIGTRLVGAKAQHAQMRLSGQGRAVSAIGFGLGRRAAALKTGSRIDVACELMKDEYGGRENLKLRIIDFKEI